MTDRNLEYSQGAVICLWLCSVNVTSSAPQRIVGQNSHLAHILQIVNSMTSCFVFLFFCCTAFDELCVQFGLLRQLIVQLVCVYVYFSLSINILCFIFLPIIKNTYCMCWSRYIVVWQQHTPVVCVLQ